ncbi:MAG: membrane protein involved in aromatic hydrocarbon degradation [Ignavibacteria bacterium]|nr:MAG: membrane protein involved in aromatic hydrocarbon degradation [Ignavibacteria bacterium]
MKSLIPLNREGNMKKFIVIITVVYCSISNVFAQNFNDALRLTEPGISLNGKALGMGNAFISRFSGVSSAQFNPAAIAFAKKAQFDASLDYNSFSNDATLFTSTRNGKQSLTNFNEVGVILPVPTVQGSMALAIGYSQSKNFNRALRFSGFNSGNNSMIQDLTDHKDEMIYQLHLSNVLDANNDYTLINGKLNQSGKILSEGGINNWYLSGAVEVEKDIFVGSTLNLLSGNFIRTRTYTEEDTENHYKSLLDPKEPKTADFISFDMTDAIKWEIAGWDLKLGIIAKVNKQVNVGFTARLPRTFTIKEIYSNSGSSLFGKGTSYSFAYDDVKSEYEISSPAEFSGGISYSEMNFTLAGEVKFIDYSAMEFPSGFNEFSLEQKNNDIKNLMRSTVNINAGGEYLIPNSSLAVRVGFMYMPSAFNDDPSEFNKKYAYGWWEDYGDNYGSKLSRTFQKIAFSSLTTSLPVLCIAAPTN